MPDNYPSSDLKTPSGFRPRGTAADATYRICTSQDPALLSVDVTELLSEGWELYGHPFFGSAVQANGNIQTSSIDVFCQAVVKNLSAFPVTAATPVHLPVTGVAKRSHGMVIRQRTKRPRVEVSFRNLSVFLTVLVGSYLVSECLIFRTGLYARYLEPESSTGSFERTFVSERSRAPRGRKDVLIVGNSRMAEGFSARLANEYKIEDGFRFFNSAVPSAGVRVLYYLVRDLDPHRDRYAAIGVPIDDYDDPDDFEDVADRASEVRLLINRLRLTDIVPYALSFTSKKSRLEVFRSALFEGTVYQLDLDDFIEHYSQRLTRVKDFREHGADWAYGYNGSDHSLAGLNVDFAHHHATFPPGMPEDQQRFLEGVFFSQPPQSGRVRDFEVHWLGALADLYRNSKTKLIFFQAPRGPAPRPAAHLRWNAVDTLRKRPWVKVIDRRVFEGLEKSDLFSDHVHLNAAGRSVFTPMLVDVMKANLP